MLSLLDIWERAALHARARRRLVRAKQKLKSDRSSLSAPAFSAVITLLYVVITTQQMNQAASVLNTTPFFWQGFAGILIAITTGIAFRLLQPVSDVWAFWADQILFTLPALLLTFRLLGATTAGVTALSAIVISSALFGRAVRKRVPSSGWSVATLLAIVLVTVALHIGLRVSPVDLGRQIGTMNLTLAFISIVALLCTCLLQRPRLGLPVILLGTASFFWNELTHELPRTDYTNYEDSSQNTGNRLVLLQEAFHTWLLSRQDLPGYIAAKKPYPIFLVSSEGGGGYAAAHAYMFLSKVQERCPHFAQHTFALVGVSGGAVGNTQFHASLGKDTNKQSPVKCGPAPAPAKLVERVRDDHLSPVIGALLFQDTPNKVLAGYLGTSDRAEALGLSIASNLKRVGATPKDTFLDHYWEYKDPGTPLQHLGMPALIHVATNSVSGMRYIFAPFALGNDSPMNQRYEEAIRDLNITEPDEVGPRSADVRLIDAAVASASFPWVTPSLMLQARSSGYVTLIDGGYLDNSGAETVSDVLTELMKINLHGDGMTLRNITLPASSKLPESLSSCENIKLRYIAPKEDPSQDADSNCDILFTVHALIVRGETSRKRYATGQSFFSDPMTGLLNTRQRRGETARYGLLAVLCKSPICDFPEGDVEEWNYSESVIDTAFLTLPLGWDIPSPSLERLYRSVAPQEGEDVPEPELHGNIHEIVDQHASPFGRMSDNQKNMRALERVLEPPAGDENK